MRYSTPSPQTSMSPIIYETLDYASGIADAEGRLLTQGNGVSGFIGMISPMICAVVDKYGKENLHPGDVYIINDPFIGGGTHMSDVGMVMPIFYNDELIAFAGNKAHWSDIGGMAPGSFTTDATNTYQEGLCFSGVKLVDRESWSSPSGTSCAATCATRRSPRATCGVRSPRSARARSG